MKERQMFNFLPWINNLVSIGTSVIVSSSTINILYFFCTVSINIWINIFRIGFRSLKGI